MRATSVEEIKDHLARGGKVFCAAVPTASVYTVENHHVIIRSTFALSPLIRTYYEVRFGEFNPQEWELEPLPLEEKCWLCNGSKTLYNEFEYVDCPECSIEKNRREIKKLDEKFIQLLTDTNKTLEDHVKELEAILCNIAIVVGVEPSKDPFECEQRILEKLYAATARTPLDDKLGYLREAIVEGCEEDALEHLFDLLKGLRCKYIEDKYLTQIGIERKAWWNESR